MDKKSLIDKPKELLELIDSCLKPKQKEKQENGEVFTPMHLINEMLDALDAHYKKENKKSIFEEDQFKWFDPAAGMGNFPVAIYLRLMDGLKVKMPDEENRKKHIIENMLYFSELNTKNVFVCKQIFDINNKYKLNIHEGDTLNLNVIEKWNLPNKFDVIIGNPPYNKGGIKSCTGKKLGDKNETVWPKFVEKSFEILKSNGFLAFITPLSWLKLSHKLHNALSTKYITWLKLFDSSKSKLVINASIPISIYILKNELNLNKNKTIIDTTIKRKNATHNSIEYIDPKYSIPLAFHSIFNKLAKFIEEKNISLEYKTKTVKSTGEKQKLPVDYKFEDMWAVDTYTIKDGILVKKTTIQHPDHDKRKLIIASKTSLEGAFIDDGKLSLTTGDKYYILGNELELLRRLLSFKIMYVVVHFTKYRQDFLNDDIFKYIPDIRKLNVPSNISEDQFYALINLTPEEIRQIKEI